MAGHVEGPTDANPAIFNGAGEARMTMADWARFCIDQLRGARGKGRLLKPQTYRLLQTAHEPRGEIGPGNPQYGLGWETLPSALGRQGPVLAHSGSDGVWIADVWLFPATGNGLLIATNSAYSMGADKAIAEATREIIPTLAPPRADVAAAKPGG
jgi:hypothetical protein